MNFQDLHELLRLELLRRIDRGLLTGTALARQTGFKQGHVSNFLNRKRSLSLEGLDRVLAAQDLSVEQLMPGESLELSAAAGEAVDDMEMVPVVTPSAALEEATPRAVSVLESVAVPVARLDGNRATPSPRRAAWQRFVAVRADGEQAAAMGPLLQPGSVAVVDRHYTTVAPYRMQQRTLYAVRAGAGLALRYVEFDSRTLVLRPLSLEFPVQAIALAAHETPADYLVGRVCLVLSEL